MLFRSPEQQAPGRARGPEGLPGPPIDREGLRACVRAGPGGWAESDLFGLPGIHIEVKRVERLNLTDAMTQAVRDSEVFHDGAPTVFHRRNRSPWLVTMRLVDWMELYQEFESGGSRLGDCGDG